MDQQQLLKQYFRNHSPMRFLALTAYAERGSGADYHYRHRRSVLSEAPAAPARDFIGAALEARSRQIGLKIPCLKELRRILSILIAVVIGLLVAMSIARRKSNG